MGSSLTFAHVCYALERDFVVLECFFEPAGLMTVSKSDYLTEYITI